MLRISWFEFRTNVCPKENPDDFWTFVSDNSLSLIVQGKVEGTLSHDWGSEPPTMDDHDRSFKSVTNKIMTILENKCLLEDAQLNYTLEIN